MTFTAKFTGTESTSGVGIFTIGDLKWQIRFPDAFAFNVACAVIEAANREGERKAAREFVSKAQEWAGGEILSEKQVFRLVHATARQLASRAVINAPDGFVCEVKPAPKSRDQEAI